MASSVAGCLALGGVASILFSLRGLLGSVQQLADSESTPRRRAVCWTRKA
jgi:hypothetical protein